jgi:Na+/phosphate symporter
LSGGGVSSDDSPAPARGTALVRLLERAFWFVLFVYLFVLALELIKCGVRPLTEWFKPEEGTHVAGALGAGWLLACVVLSGSPVAALALGFFDGGALGQLEAFGMVNGSRLGAAFVVLVVGTVYDLRAGRASGGAYVGVLALVATFSIYLPAFWVGYLLLESGWLDGLRFQVPALGSVIDWATGPVVGFTGRFLQQWAQSLVGILALVGAFRLFDWTLPRFVSRGRLETLATAIFRPWIPFVVGMAVTCITLSVSVSLSLLVPLTVRGVVRRENLGPYILGANITTFVDTLLASLLLDNPVGFTVILCQVVAVSLVSLPVVFLASRPFDRFLDWAARGVSLSRVRLTVFVATLFVVPLFLIFGARLFVPR